ASQSIDQRCFYTLSPPPLCLSQCGDVLYEKRHYEKAHWACITVHEDTYKQSICYGFMKLMRYICQQNSSGESKAAFTVVIESKSTADSWFDVTVAYYLPTEYQAQPPQPSDIEINSYVPLYRSRAFAGATNEVTIINEIRTMAEVLDSPAICVNGSFIVAGYKHPEAVNRQNEIWFLEQP
uniref:Heme-binding protein soul3 n=1 Tax=Salmo trutta TaxID=8032 RepID=A0A674A463_SALTR